MHKNVSKSDNLFYISMKKKKNWKVSSIKSDSFVRYFPLHYRENAFNAFN